MYSIYLIALGIPDENFAVNGPGTMPVVDLFKFSDFSEQFTPKLRYIKG